MTNEQILKEYHFQLLNFLHSTEAQNEICYVKKKEYQDWKRVQLKQMVMDEIKSVGKYIAKIQE